MIIFFLFLIINLSQRNTLQVKYTATVKYFYYVNANVLAEYVHVERKQYIYIYIFLLASLTWNQ